VRRVLSTTFRWLFATAFWVIIVSVLWVALLGVLDPPVTWHMVDQAREHGSLHRQVVPLNKIARVLPLAVIASEDQLFMVHNGFSTEQIKRALGMKEPGFSMHEFVGKLFDKKRKSKPGRNLKGASTISQQTAKNVFLWHGRTYLRKGLEAWFTVLMELLWTKERILEVYLNTAEMGRGIFGAEAAAQQCFGRPAAALTAAQAAMITATLPNPVRYSCQRPGPYLLGRQQWTLRQMRNIGDVLDPEVRQRQQERREREEARKRKRRVRK
jgi:monofunctional glycosyltransferase